MEFFELARESVRDLFEAQVANFRVLDLLRFHDAQVKRGAADARENLAGLSLDDEAKDRIARQIAQTFVRPASPNGDGDLEDIASRMAAKATELAGLAMLKMEERDFTGLTIRRDLSARSRESLLVTLWSDFEAFVAELFRLLADRQPAPLVPPTKEVKLKDLLDHGSVEALTQHLAQEAIDSVFRKPFEEWIADLCSLYSLEMPTISDALRESYLRRNIVVHAGAVANSLYLAKIATLAVPKPDKGSRLSVDHEYLERVADDLAAVAFALAISSVAKHDALHLDSAESEFTNLCYILLLEGRPGAVLLIGEKFRTSRFRTQSAKEIMRVNYWLACRDLGTLDGHAKEVDEWDTSALDDSLRLAKLVLSGKLPEALARARELRESGALQERLWKTWPLFRDLRAMERKEGTEATIDEAIADQGSVSTRDDPEDPVEGEGR